MTPDDITRLAEKWRGESGDYPESKLDCADELEAVLAQQGKAGGVADEEGRQEFERWAKKRHGFSVARWDDSGEYTSHLTRNWWQCWTESRSTSRATPPAHSPDAGNMVPAGIVGEVVEIGDGESGQPRILIHTTREAIKAYAGNLLFRQVIVADAPQPKDAT